MRRDAYDKGEPREESMLKIARFALSLGIGLMVAFFAAACAQPEEAAQTAAPEEGEATTVGVKLQEWSVVPDESSVPAGEVMFEVENVGENEHEFMVVRTNLDLTELPTKDDGSLDDEGDDVEVIDAMNAEEHGDGEHATIEPGDEKEFSYELEEGNYVLVCNLVEETEEEEPEVHFKLGMRIPFTVT